MPPLRPEPSPAGQPIPKRSRKRERELRERADGVAERGASPLPLAREGGEGEAASSFRPDDRNAHSRSEFALAGSLLLIAMTDIGACFLSLIAMKRIGGRIIYKERAVSLDGTVSICPRVGVMEECHGLDHPDSRRDLHRPRDQRLSAGRVLIRRFFGLKGLMSARIDAP
jgi:hypothetical protein